MRIQYYIKGLVDKSAAEALLDDLVGRIDGCEITLDEDGCLELAFESEREPKVRELTEALLAERNLEFAHASDNEVYVSLPKKKAKGMPIYAAVCAIIAAVVISALTTFAICKTYMEGSSYPPTPGTNQGANQGGGSGGGSSVEYVEMDVPSYFSNLIKLDEFFRTHSFDGYDQDEMSEAILDAYIAATGDIYAEYLNAEEYAAYFEERSGEFVGIGVSIVNSNIEIDGAKYKVIEVISVFKDSPAIENGIKVGDCIMYVECDGEMKLVNEIGYDKATDNMLGESGTNAKFIVFRPNGGDYEQLEFEITRRKVESQSVTYKVSETDSNIGIISITGFDLTTPEQFKDAINTLQVKHGCTKFVFDLRNNPGGSLDSICNVLCYFLDEGDEIVSIEYADGSSHSITATYADTGVTPAEMGIYKNLDCVVLTNGNTASAAELFTATMRDYGIAEIVGTKTYGKGCMQTLYPLASYGIEGGLKLTVAMYFSASKTVYHGTGIIPDYEIDLSSEAKEINFYLLPESMDAQLGRAIEILTSK